MSRKFLLALAAAGLFLAAGIGLVWYKTARTAWNGQDITAPAAAPAPAPAPEAPFAEVLVTQPVSVSAYFEFMDHLVARYDSLTPYPLSEHLIARANPWLIDSLAETDYYRQIARGNFVYDQRKMTVLHPGTTLRLPGPQTAAALLETMKNTWLDINIPAFQLHIRQKDSVLHTFPVRVGKTKRKFLVMAGGSVDLRTRTGEGEIIRIARKPAYYDPVTGRQFSYTKRDDGKLTHMPTIPWIEPSINGMRYGQMIHPTTNPVSLGKASSNGCIGVGEGDAWRIYYAAPLGTRVVVRYDLVEITAAGDTLRHPDVYEYAKRGKQAGTYTYAGMQAPETVGSCWCDP